MTCIKLRNAFAEIAFNFSGQFIPLGRQVFLEDVFNLRQCVFVVHIHQQPVQKYLLFCNAHFEIIDFPKIEVVEWRCCGTEKIVVQ